MKAVAGDAITAQGLTKEFATGWRGARVRALDRLDLAVDAGEVFGLLGPNGSGKSTAIKLLLGLLTPTAGVCHVAGGSGGGRAVRAQVGYLPEAPEFYRWRTGRELVAFYGAICGVPARELAARVAETLAWVGLPEEAFDRRVGTYSKGMLQRVGLAQALVHDPAVVILDEPTAGVDPLGAAAMCTLIGGLKERGKTVLITSHLLDHIEEVCDRVAILHRGRKIAEGAVAELTSAGAPGWQVDGLAPAQVPELRAWLAERGGGLRATAAERSRLEEVFCRRVAEAERSGA